MLRIWKGKELEGYYQGSETLFVCSDKSLDIKFIKNIILNNNIKRVYLGAGRERFKGFGNYKADKEFVDFCNDFGIILVIETEPTYLSDLIYFLEYAQIILSIRIKSFKLDYIRDLYLKLDDFTNVKIFNNNEFKITNLQELKNNGMFKGTDELIYEEV